MSKTFSIRWKILAGMMALAIIPILLLTNLFSSMTSQYARSQMDLMADQAGRFVMQTVAHEQEVMTEGLSLLAEDENLRNVAHDSDLSGDFSQLQTLINYYRTKFGFDRVDIVFVDGKRFSLDLTENPSSPDSTAEENPLKEVSDSESNKIIHYHQQLSIFGVAPLHWEDKLIGDLTAYRFINDRLTRQFQATIEGGLAFHDGKRVVSASMNELKTAHLNLNQVLQEDKVSLPLKDRTYVLYNYPLFNNQNDGLLIALDRPPIDLASKNMQKTLMLVVIGVLGLATLLGLLISRGIARPLNSVVQNLQEIAEGEADLTKTLLVTARDEVGLLAGSFNKFITRLRDMVQRTRATADSLSASTKSIRSKFAEVNRGAIEQTNALESSLQSVTEIGNSADDIADNVSTLVASVQQSAAATHELESTNLSISEQTEELFRIITGIYSSIHDLSSSNEQINSNIGELSNSAKETSVSVEHLEQATSAIEASAMQTSQLAQQAVAQSLEGKAAVQDTIRGISGLQQLIEQTHLAIQELGARSDAIGNIVNVIAEIADQTNLLALNAAIIAAQAGEHGQGFAVVAGEIRNLAERTSISTKEIAEIIESLQQGTTAAVTAIEAGSIRAHQEVDRSHAAGEALEKLYNSSLNSTEQITSIAQETQNQSEENRKITQAVIGITRMLEQIAAAISQQTVSTRNLSNAAESMKSIAARVKNSTAEQGRGSRQIAQSMEHIQNMIELIDSATRGQSERCNDVVQAVARVRQIAEENANRAADMDTVVEDLSEQGKGLAAEMGTFMV